MTPREWLVVTIITLAGAFFLLGYWAGMTRAADIICSNPSIQVLAKEECQ